MRGLNQATVQICNLRFLLQKNWRNNIVKRKILLLKTITAVTNNLVFSRRTHTDFQHFFFHSPGKEIFMCVDGFKELLKANCLSFSFSFFSVTKAQYESYHKWLNNKILGSKKSGFKERISEFTWLQLGSTLKFQHSLFSSHFHDNNQAFTDNISLSEELQKITEEGTMLLVSKVKDKKSKPQVFLFF